MLIQIEYNDNLRAMKTFIPDSIYNTGMQLSPPVTCNASPFVVARSFVCWVTALAQFISIFVFIILAVPWLKTGYDFAVYQFYESCWSVDDEALFDKVSRISEKRRKSKVVSGGSFPQPMHNYFY